MMIPGYRLLIVFVLLFFTGHRSAAQPVLPDIAATFDKDVVQLTWECQYDGIKSITVMRSKDSAKNYVVIGKVKRVKKGMQEYEDKHPAAGANYYELTILFSSGLTWNSNHCRVMAGEEPEHEDEPDSTDDEVPAVAAVKVTDPAHKEETPVNNTNNTPAGGNIVYNKDTIRVTGIAADTVKKRDLPKIAFKFTVNSDADADPSTFMIPRFIKVDDVTGHIDIYLPDDTNLHHYSVRFYDANNNMITEVPQINEQYIIMDRRNFQHKGTYKFVLRRDVTELETGWLKL